jgi:hypothetical protein
MRWRRFVFASFSAVAALVAPIAGAPNEENPPQNDCGLYATYLFLHLNDIQVGRTGSARLEGLEGQVGTTGSAQPGQLA